MQTGNGPFVSGFEPNYEGSPVVFGPAGGVSRARGFSLNTANFFTTDEEIEAAVDTPPQTTRAKLRGEFISAAQEAGRDFTVDWVHLKLNDQAQRTVLCKDPFRSTDERVKRLIARM